MSLDLEIQSLLRSPQVNEINFNMRGILVTGQGYLELSNCFSDQAIRHRIRVTVRPELVSPGAVAEYLPGPDKICLRSNMVFQIPVWRSDIVHECTHAQIDLRAVATPIQNEEGAAFIAQAWYMLASNVDQAWIDQIVTTEIREIATDLRAQSLLPGGPVQVSQNQIEVARRMMLQFGYRSGHYTSNGIRGLRYSGA